MSINARLAELGITLPKAAAPAANYIPFVLHDGLLHVAGQIPFDASGKLVLGRLGETMDVAAGQEAARLCGLGILAQANAALGSLDRVARVIKLGVFVASAGDFTQQPEVANGASDLMVEVFGDSGRHARSAVGVPVLPRGVAVEVDAIIAVSG
jgi:enamine deaminase RidA (YjgF/YER057c/UK114 family)